MKLRSLVATLAVLLCARQISAQIQYPPETRNAALRYWMAFAEMQDVPTDPATQELLEKILSDEAKWDEQKVAPVLDANMPAIQMMQRATKLPECDWGLEYSRGARTSIAYAPRARALSRLNTLEGMRQLAAGDSAAAVNTWLAGVRFSQDLARGGSLIFAVMAKSALLSNIRELREAVLNGKLPEAQRKRVAAAIRALPEDGFNWAAAWGVEAASLQQFLFELRSAPSPGAVYEATMGSPAPKSDFPPTAQSIHLYSDYMLAVQSALREPPGKAKATLDSLEAKRIALTEVEQKITPSPQKSNSNRIEVMNARAELLQALNPK